MMNRLSKDGRGAWVVAEYGADRAACSSLFLGRDAAGAGILDSGNRPEVYAAMPVASLWYRTGWAYCLYFGLAALLAWGIMDKAAARARYRREKINRENELLNKAKSQFLINISHEIRSRMTLIIDPLRRLLGESAGELHHKTFLTIYRNAQRLLWLMNQLMDLQKLDKGQMRLKFRETDMVALIADVMQLFEYVAHERNIEYTFLHDAPELKAWVDLDNFDKVLVNVLSNAFEHTPEGGKIQVSLSNGRDASRKGALRNYFEIVVTDSGTGDKNKIERVFERLHQKDSDEVKSKCETGIGLHLSYLLVQLHHGKIRVENRTDAPGCRFIIRMPSGSGHLRADEKEKAASFAVYPQLSDTQGKDRDDADEKLADKPKTHQRVLVVEDEEEIRTYLKQELSDEYKVAACRNGKEAYDCILKEMPDLVISDITMPEMDGLTLCHKLKQNTNINHIPIILLTAKSRTEDILEGIKMGADAYIVKPFHTELLKSTIANLITNRRLLRNKFSGAQQQEEKIGKISMKSGDEILMERIMKVVNTHLNDPEFNVEMLASEIGLSRVHVHRKLKELTNLSTRDFIKNIRLQQAASLLEQNKKITISEVAYAVGYTNLSHFSSSFKEKYGVSPKEYMNKQNDGNA